MPDLSSRSKNDGRPWWCDRERKLLRVTARIIPICAAPTPFLFFCCFFFFFFFCLQVSVWAGSHIILFLSAVGFFIVHVWCATQTRPRFYVPSERRDVTIFSNKHTQRSTMQGPGIEPGPFPLRRQMLTITPWPPIRLRNNILAVIKDFCICFPVVSSNSLHTNKQLNKQTNRQTNKQRNKETNKQTKN